MTPEWAAWWCAWAIWWRAEYDAVPYAIWVVLSPRDRERLGHLTPTGAQRLRKDPAARDRYLAMTSKG